MGFMLAQHISCVRGAQAVRGSVWVKCHDILSVYRYVSVREWYHGNYRSEGKLLTCRRRRNGV